MSISYTLLLIYLGLLIGVVLVDFGIIWVIYYKLYYGGPSFLDRFWGYITSMAKEGFEGSLIVYLIILILAIPPSIAALVILMICLVSQDTDIWTKITFSSHMGAYLLVGLIIVLIFRCLVLKNDINEERHNKKHEKLKYYSYFKLNQ